MAAEPSGGGGVHTTLDRSDPVFTWDYRMGRGELAVQYGSARAGWSAVDLPWEHTVDPTAIGGRLARLLHVLGPPAATDDLGGGEGVEVQRWLLANLLHCEQGALLCSGKLIEAAPWIEAKLLASAQAADEARHVEVLARYLEDKLGGGAPIDGALGRLLDDVLADGRWDVTCMGMNLLVKGFTLGCYRALRQLALEAGEPLLAELLARVLEDERRHIGFGVVAVRYQLAGLRRPQLRERQELALEVVRGIHDRLRQGWAGVGASGGPSAPQATPAQVVLERLLLADAVAACDAVGLLDDEGSTAPGWLRTRFIDLGVAAPAATALEHAPSVV